MDISEGEDRGGTEGRTAQPMTTDAAADPTRPEAGLAGAEHPGTELLDAELPGAELPGAELPGDLPGAGDEAEPVGELIGRIAEGRLEVTHRVPLRQRCVAHLLEQGFTVADTASVLRIGERTVNRDRAAIRAAGALRPTLGLADELLGEFQRRVEGSVARLTRLASDPQTPPYARLWAEESIARIYGRFVDAAAKLGYLRGAGDRLNDLRAADPNELDRVRDRRRRRQDLLEVLNNLGRLSTPQPKPRRAPGPPAPPKNAPTSPAPPPGGKPPPGGVSEGPGVRGIIGTR